MNEKIIKKFLKEIEELKKENTTLKNKLEKKKKRKEPTKRYAKEWLSKKEIDKLFSSPGISSRDLLLMKVCYHAAVRISEALNAKREDFKYEDDYSFLVLKSQKTDKLRWEKQPLPVETYADVQRFCDDNKIKTQDYVFQSRQSEKLSYNRAYQIMGECAEKAGITKKITTHTFRRSRLTHLLDDGDDPFFCQDFARHDSIDTTRNYLKGSKKKIHSKMEKIDKKKIHEMIN